jgi:hypothetical protein
MAIQGLRTSGNFATNERPGNWREALLRLNPNGNVSLTALTSLMKSESTDDPEFNWWEKARNARRLTLDDATGDLTTSNTGIILETGQDAAVLKDGDLLMVEQTGEIIRVNGDPASGVNFVVQRAQNGTTAAALDPNAAGKNPNLLVIGSAYEEASLAPTGISYDPTKKSNYTQIFRDSLEMSRTASKTRLRTGDQVKEAKRETLEMHAQGIERALWLGTKYEGTKNGKPYRTTGGFKYFLDNYNGGSNVKDAKVDYASGVTMDALETYMYDMFRYGSNEKMVFAGNRALLTIQQIVRKNGELQITSGIKEYGMNVSRLSSPFGELVIKNHPMFNEVPGGTTGGTAYYGMEAWLAVVDMANLKYRYLNGSDTQYQAKQEDNGLDGMKSGYLTECGMEFHHPETHFLIKNFHAGAADA